MIISIISFCFEIFFIIIIICGMIDVELKIMFLISPLLVFLITIFIIIRKYVFFRKNYIVYNFKKIKKEDIIKIQLKTMHGHFLGFSYFFNIITKTKEYNLYIGWFGPAIINKTKRLCLKYCIKFELKHN